MITKIRVSCTWPDSITRGWTLRHVRHVAARKSTRKHAAARAYFGDFWLGNLKNEDPGRLHAVRPDYTWMHVTARGCMWLHVEARGGTCMHEDARLYLIGA